MDILIMAKELGEAIADSKEMKDLKVSDTNLQVDEKAMALMNEYKQLQIELVRDSREKRDNETIDEIKEMLLMKQQQLNDYEITNSYLEAKTAFDKFMKNINDVINYAITGEDQCTPDKCGSCSGCK
jgi:Uncharacterized conserved protein